MPQDKGIKVSNRPMKPVYGPGNKNDYDAFGFRNNTINRFSSKVKDVEMKKKGQKSKMINKPGY